MTSGTDGWAWAPAAGALLLAVLTPIAVLTGTPTWPRPDPEIVASEPGLRQTSAGALVEEHQVAPTSDVDVAAIVE